MKNILGYSISIINSIIAHLKEAVNGKLPASVFMFLVKVCRGYSLPKENAELL